jgi:hypothetical protein
MIIICPRCNDVVELSEDQLNKAKEIFAKMPEGKTLKVKCLSCEKPIDLKPESFSQKVPETIPPTQPKDNSKLIIEDKAEYKTKNINVLPVYEFKTIYIPVDSVHEGEKLVESFDISPLQKLGKLGWDITAVVSRTLSQTFCNEVDATFPKKPLYSAACGGNVMGVHIILRRCIV